MSLLPRTIDDRYDGRKAALWLFGLLALVRLAMGLNIIFNGREVATNADGIPLGIYPPDAAQTIVALFAIWGLAQLLLASGCFLVLARYRSVVPFMFLVLAVEQLLRRIVLYYVPMVRTAGAPAFAINVAILALTILGFALSLWRRRTA